MQAQGSLFQGSMIGSFIDIYQQEGTKGLWRVSTPFLLFYTQFLEFAKNTFYLKP